MALSRAAINCTEPCFPDSDEDFEDDDEISIPAHPLPSGRKKKQMMQIEPSFDHSDYDFPYNDDGFSLPTFLPPSARTKKLAKQKTSISTKKSKSKRRKPASSFGPVEIAGRDDDESRIEGSVYSYATGSIYSDFRQGDEDEDDDASRTTFGSVPRLLNIKGDTTTKQLTKAELSIDSEQKPRAKKACEQEPDNCAKSIVSERSKTTNKSTGIRKLPSQEERLVHSAKEARVKEFSEEELDSFGKNSLLDKKRSFKTTANVIENLLSKGETAIEKMLYPEKIFSAKNTEEEVGSLANDCSPEKGSKLKKSRWHDDGMSSRSATSSKRSKSKSKEGNPPSVFDHVVERSNLKKSSGRDEGMSQRSVSSSKASKRSKSKEEQRDRVRDEDPPTKFDPVVEDKNTRQSTENDLKPSVTWDLNPGTFRRVHTYACPPDADSRRSHKRLLDLKMQETSQGGETKASQMAAPDTKNESKLSKKTKDSILWWLPSLPSFGPFLGKDESEKPAGKSADDKAKTKKELAKLAEGVAAFNTRHMTELVEKRRAGIADLDEVRANVEKIKASLNERKNQRTLVQRTVEERMKKCLKVVEDGMVKQKAIEEKMAKYQAKYAKNPPKPMKRKKSFRVAGLVDSPPVKHGMKTALDGSEEKQLKAAKSKEFDYEHWAREETEEVKIYSRPLRARRPIIHQLKPFRDAWDDVVAVTEDVQRKLPTCA